MVSICGTLGQYSQSKANLVWIHLRFGILYLIYIYNIYFGSVGDVTLFGEN